MHDIGYGGTRYGYVHQPRNNRIEEKVSKLKWLGCHEVIYDIGLGNRENLDRLLGDICFRDYILFYDHSVFQTLDELHDIFSLCLDDPEGNKGFDCGFYDRSLSQGLSLTSEHTTKYRKKYARKRRFNVAINWFLKPRSLSFK